MPTMRSMLAASLIFESPARFFRGTFIGVADDDYDDNDNDNDNENENTHSRTRTRDFRPRRSLARLKTSEFAAGGFPTGRATLFRIALLPDRHRAPPGASSSSTPPPPPTPSSSSSSETFSPRRSYWMTRAPAPTDTAEQSGEQSAALAEGLRRRP